MVCFYLLFGCFPDQLRFKRFPLPEFFDYSKIGLDPPLIRQAITNQIYKCLLLKISAIFYLFKRKLPAVVIRVSWRSKWSQCKFITRRANCFKANSWGPLKGSVQPSPNFKTDRFTFWGGDHATVRAVCISLLLLHRQPRSGVCQYINTHMNKIGWVVETPMN